jgi:lincosamide nucleotidyltransferase A/C/D/E
MTAAAQVMTAASALAVLEAVGRQGVSVCVGGGWAVDALLGEQTREHGDLDLWADAADLHPLFLGLTGAGVDAIMPWPGDRPWNFVLHDRGRLRVDLHLYEHLDGGSLRYGSFNSGLVLPVGALEGVGVVGGVRLRCEAPSWTLRCHQGYPPRDLDRQDMARLCRRFGLDLPAELA